MTDGSWRDGCVTFRAGGRFPWWLGDKSITITHMLSAASVASV